MNQWVQSMLGEGQIGIVNDSVAVDVVDYWTYGSDDPLSSTAVAVPAAVPQCKDQNPYVLKGDGWVPQHIAIADRTVYAYFTIFMLFQFLLSTSLNSIVIVVIYKFEELRQPLNYIIVNLALANLLRGGIGGFLSMLSNGAGYFFLGKGMCYAEGYAVSLFGCVGLNLIVVLVIERFLEVCKPFGSVRMGAKATWASIFVAWAWSFFWNTPFLMLRDGYEPEGLGTTCAPNWFVTGENERMFITLYYVCCFLLQYAVMVICYWKLFLTLRELAKETSPESSSPETEVLKMVVASVSAFFVSWLPYAAFVMYSVVNHTAQISYESGAITAFLAKTTTICNPLLYVGLSRHFRDCVIRTFFAGRNPWTDDLSASSMMSMASSQISSKVGPA
ncbi:unnamed protein product [Clavelina lepadiformis]|uniref:G-protein coupled receptors family 1 profile domain-containing protein n=1 Tax=Clavelina lepadiformis TaxID=159417 RepID=A0ABP0H2K1_CLALP